MERGRYAAFLNGKKSSESESSSLARQARYRATPVKSLYQAPPLLER